MSVRNTAQRTILVVEDELLIRMDIADVLRSCGWRVLEAGDSAEAIAALKAGASVDLVFSDIQMPGAIDGFGLAAWLRAYHPSIRIILTSGTVDKSPANEHLCDEGPIAKPYDPLHIAERIRHLTEVDVGRGRDERSERNEFSRRRV